MGDEAAYPLDEALTAEKGEAGVSKLPTACSSPVVEKEIGGEGSGSPEEDCGVKSSAPGELHKALDPGRDIHNFYVTPALLHADGAAAYRPQAQSPMSTHKVVNPKSGGGDVVSAGPSPREHDEHAEQKPESLSASSLEQQISRIMRVESTAESIVDAWAPVFQGASVGSPKDTASDYELNEVDREASTVHFGLWPREADRVPSCTASEEDAESGGAIEALGSLVGSRDTMPLSCDLSSDSLESDTGNAEEDEAARIISVPDEVLSIGVLSTSPLQAMMLGRRAISEASSTSDLEEGNEEAEARLCSASEIDSCGPERLDLSGNEPTPPPVGDPHESESDDSAEDQSPQCVRQRASRRAPFGMSGNIAVLEALSSSDEEIAVGSSSCSSDEAAEEEEWAETSSAEENDLSPHHGQHTFSSSSDCSNDSVECTLCTLGLNGGGCGGGGDGDEAPDDSVSCLTCDISSLWAAATAASATRAARATRARSLSTSPLSLPPAEPRAPEPEASPNIATEREAIPHIAAEREAIPHIAAEREAIPHIAAEREAIPHIAAEREAIPHIAAEREAIPQIAAEREAIPHIAAEREPIPHIAAEREASPVIAMDGPTHRGFWIRRYLRHIGLVRTVARVEPDRGELEPPSPASDLPYGVEPVKRAFEDDSPWSRLKEDPAPAFGAGPTLRKPSLRGNELFDSDGETDGDSTPSTRSSSRHDTARVSDAYEGDIEEGKARELGAGDGSSRAVPRVVVSRDVAVAVSNILAAVGEEQTMVLPCAPSDDEKYSYLKTGRLGFIPVALVSFLTMSVGMWLFTIAHPVFYWFGAPSAFLVIYLGFHYLAVAVWGKDFSTEKHAEIIHASEQQSYEPSVDVFLPVCREPAYLLANTWKHVSALDYPNYRVHVLDDGDKEEVKALAEAFGFNYMVRPDRPSLKKAGNLRHAFARTSGEAIAIFDADFCPRSDFLKETVPYLGHDASIGIVQTPQYFRYRKEQTWIEKGAGVTQEFFYRMVQVNQDKFNAAVCVGSCGLYRRSALQPFGGVAAVAHSEDMYTGFKMTEQGYKIKYVPLPVAMGTCPDEPQSFFMQQYRWAMGSATLVLQKDFWWSNISSLHKICFLNGMLYYTATAVMLFLGPMPFLLLVWIQADEVLWYHSGFMVPAILCSMILMPLWSTQRYGMACHRIRIIQCYAHLYAIKDRIMGRAALWVPSGSGSSRGASATYKSSVRLLVVWNMLATLLVVAGSIWRPFGHGVVGNEHLLKESMTEYTWYHFVPAMAIALGSFFLNMSTLIFRRK